MLRKIKKFRNRPKSFLKNSAYTSFLTTITLAATISILPLQAQNIVVDGNTNTVLRNNSNITDITTSTIHKTTAFNSFQKFNILENQVVNLILPQMTSKLVNIIKEGPSSINGVLNSLKDGQLGGEIFLVNPEGLIIGNSGVINVGSLVVATPTNDFVDNFFSKPGVVNLENLYALENSTYEVNPSAVFKNQGKIQALNNIDITAGSVINDGTMEAGRLAEKEIKFEDLVNTENLENAGYLVAEDSFVSIKAENDIANVSYIAAYGENNSQNNLVELKAKNDIKLLAESEIQAKGFSNKASGGRIDIFAGNNTTFEEGASLDVSAGENLGNAGVIELSANNTVYAFGQFNASAQNGKAGTIFIDPNQVITNNVFTDGADFIVNANNIVVQGVIISTRDIENPIIGNHFLDPSQGNSGKLEFTTPGQIDLQADSKIYTFADEGFSSGAATLIGNSINLNYTYLETGNSILQGEQINILNQTEIVSDNNVTLNVVNEGLLTLDNSSITTDNGITINGPAAGAELNDFTLFSMGENGIDIDLYNLDVTTNSADAAFISIGAGIDIDTKMIEVDPSAETQVLFMSLQDVNFFAEDLYLAGDPQDNSSIVISSGNDTIFQDNGASVIDIYNTTINADGRILFDTPETMLTILDSDFVSSGTDGIDLTAMILNFVGYDANASMTTENGDITITALQTTFESDYGSINIVVNGKESDLNIDAASLMAFSIDKDIKFKVNDGDINLELAIGSIIGSYYGNPVTLEASNNIDVTNGFLTIYGPGVDLIAGNTINMELGDFEPNFIFDANFNAKNEVCITATDATLKMENTNINASNIDIKADTLTIKSLDVDTYLKASDEYVSIQANDLLIEAKNADLTLSALNGLVVFAAPDIDFETPNTTNDIIINAQNALILGDNISITDSTNAQSPGKTDFNISQNLLIQNTPFLGSELIVNPQVTDAVTQSDLLDNDIFIDNTEINAINLEIVANSNIQFNKTIIETLGSTIFDTETLQGEPDSSIIIEDTQITNKGQGGITVYSDAITAFTTTDNLNIISESSDIVFNSNFTNIFGNLAGSELNIEAANDIIFTGDHTNIGMNIINPFQNDFNVNINAGKNFEVKDFTESTLILRNSDVEAGAVKFSSLSGNASIVDSKLLADGPDGITIDAAELEFYSYLDNVVLKTTQGAINLNSSTNVLISTEDVIEPVVLDSASMLNINALGTALNEGNIDILAADVDSGGIINFTANKTLSIYAGSTVHSNSPIRFVAPKLYLGLSETATDPVGLNMESPVEIVLTSDSLTIDPSQSTEIGANGSLNINRFTLGNVYYGNDNQPESLNISPEELNNLWSSFIILGNLPEVNENTNNILINANVNLPNGITLYSNDLIAMNAETSINCFSAVLNSDEITIGDKASITSEIVDLTADTLRISTIDGTTVTGNSEVRVDRKTPGDFIVSNTGNFKGINSVSAIGNTVRKVSLGLNSNNLQDVEVGQRVIMPCEFEINAQGNIIDSLDSEEANITSEGLTIKARELGTVSEDFNINLSSGVLKLDLTRSGYVKANTNDVYIDSIVSFDPLTNHYSDILLTAANGSILQNDVNAIDVVSNNAQILAKGNVDLDISAQDSIEIEGENVSLGFSYSHFLVVSANQNLLADNVTGDIIWFFVENDSNITNLVANDILLSTSAGELVMDNFTAGMTSINTGNNLTLSNGKVLAPMLLTSESDIVAQGAFYNAIDATATNSLVINNSTATFIDTIQASDVQISSLGSIIDASEGEDSNIIAENIKLTSINASIGRPQNDLNVTLLDSRLDATAAGYINIKTSGDFELGNVTSQLADVRLEAENGCIMANNGVIRGNHVSVLADEILVSENTDIIATGDIGFATDTFTITSPEVPAIEANGAIVLSRYSPGGMIVLSDRIQDSNSRAPIHINLNAFSADELVLGNSSLTNNATNTIFINDQLLYDRNKLTLSANELIYDRNDDQPSVIADNLTLISGKDIGLENNLFDANIENNLIASASGNIYLKDHNKDLLIDTIENPDGSIYLTTAQGDVNIGTIKALKQIIITAGGRIIAIDHLDPEDVVISVKDSAGIITINDGSVSNSVDLKANNITANFIDTGHSGLYFDLSNINNTRANQINVVANSPNSVIFNKLFSANAQISNNTIGGAVILRDIDVSEELNVFADNIDTQLPANVQSVKLTGIEGQRANTIYFEAPNNLNINVLRADTADIETTGDILELVNAQVYNTGEFSNSSKRVILDNLGTFKDFKSVDAILFTRDIFDLYLDTSANIQTSADILFVRPDLNVNGSYNTYEEGKAIALTTSHAYTDMDNTLNQTYYKDYTSDFFTKDDVNVFAFVRSSSYNKVQNLGITSYLLDKAIVAYRGALLNNYSEQEALRKASQVLIDANISKEVAQQILKNPHYVMNEDSQKILTYYVGQ